jgi:MFS family permease
MTATASGTTDRGFLGRFPLLRPLAVRDFRLLWAGQGVSLVGDQFHAVALAWLVLALTGSGLALGAVLIAVAIPRALLIVVGGALSDRIAPRRLLLVSDIARGVAVGLVTALVLSGRIEVWHLVAMGVVFGTADALFFPAMNAIVPALIEADRLEAANAIVQGTIQLTSLIGPAIAGLLVAAVGTGPAFAIDTASFAVAALCLLAIRPVGPGATAGVASTPTTPDETGPAAVARPRRSIGHEIVAGIRYAASDPAIATLLVLAAALNLAFSGSIPIGLPWLASERFGGDAALFGVMIAGFGGGALLGAMLGGSLPRPRRQSPVLMAISAGLGLGLGAIGLAPSAAIVVALLAAIGLGVGYINVVVIAWLQTRIQPDMRGRVMGLVMLSAFGLAPISLAAAGALVDVAATAMFLVAGAIIFVAIAAATLTGAASRLDLEA